MKNRFALLFAAGVGLLIPPGATIAYGLAATATPSSDSGSPNVTHLHIRGTATHTHATSSGRVRELAGAFDRKASNMDLVEVRRFAKFPLYAVGDAFEGFQLRTLNYFARSQPNPGEEALPLPEYVQFIYGSCAPDGCSLPLVIQVWPACVRNLAGYSYDPKKLIPIPHVRDRLKNVPAAYFGDGRLELYTGGVTIVIFAPSDEDRAYRAAHALRGMNRAVEASDPLPAPAAGAMEGKLRCR